MIKETTPVSKAFALNRAGKVIESCRKCGSPTKYFKCAVKGYIGISFDCTACSWSARMYKPVTPELVEAWDAALYGKDQP